MKISEARTLAKWFGALPSGWSERRISSLAHSAPRSFTDGDWIESPFITDSGIRLIQTGNIGRGVYKEQGFRFVSPSTFRTLHCTEVRPGDLLICRLGDPVSRSCLAPDLGVPMITSVDVCILRVRQEIDPRFVNYVLNSPLYLAWVAAQVRGSTRDRVSRSMLGSFPVPVPSFETQTQIADHLDRETAEIDAFITDQEKLIELLTERRKQAVRHAVTGRSHEHGSLRDSGENWLGEIPEHWQLPQTRHVASVSSGLGIDLSLLSKDASALTGRVPVFGGNGLVGYHQNSNAPAGSLAVGRVGALCGNVHWLNQASWVSDNALRVIPRHSVVGSRFLAHALMARELNDLADRTAQPLITGSLVSSQKIPLPPLEEQARIVEWIDEQVADTDLALVDARLAISLSKERRAALISAAVTGKIDVREHGKAKA